MQRLFTRFPSGWPGVGLLLLRTAVGLVAACQGANCLLAPDATTSVVTAGLLPLAVGGAVVLGILTPIASLVLALIYAALAFSVFPCLPDHLFIDRVGALFGIVASCSLALLGPGAFSFDARLFGHREIFIPRDGGSHPT